nr:cell wall-binding repeat-containing protein [uncultured Peptostreptococcus sp.]
MKIKKMELAKKGLVGLFVASFVAMSASVPSSALWKNYRPYGGFDGGWKRFYGADRIKTAEYTANSLNPHKNASDVYPLTEDKSVPTVLVNQNSFQDGLSAYNLCRAFNARLLLIRPDYANIGLMKEYYKSKTVYLIGSEKEIYPSTEKYIKKNMPKANVIRIGDASVYDRNIATIKIAGFSNLAVADGRKFPDALTASGLCHNKNLGLMLVDGSKSYSLPTGTKVSYTVGGSDSVSQDGGTRLAGSDRYETAKEVAREAKGYYNILFVDGRKFPDSISAINLVKPRNSIIMPISDTRDNSDMKEFLTMLPQSLDEPGQWDIEKSGYAIVIGGENSIKDSTIIKMLYPSKGLS